MPGHQGFQLFMGERLAQVRQQRQGVEKVIIGIDPVCFCRFCQRVHNRAGFRSLDRVAEQSVLSAQYKGADRILGQIVGDGNIPMLQECSQLPLLVPGMPYRILQLAALFRVQRVKPTEILLQNGRNDVLAVFSAIFIFLVRAFLLKKEQLVAVLVS